MTRTSRRKSAGGARPDAHTLRRISVVAEVDPRTVGSFLRGERVMRATALVITRALRKLQLDSLVAGSSRPPARD